MSTQPAHTTASATGTAAQAAASAAARARGTAHAAGHPASGFASLLQGLSAQPDPALDTGGAEGASPEAEGHGDTDLETPEKRAADARDEAANAASADATLPPDQRAAHLGHANWLAAARARAQAAEAAGRGRHAAGVDALAGAADARALAAAEDARTLAGVGRPEASDPAALALDPAAWQAAQAAQAPVPAADTKALVVEATAGQPHGAEFALPSLGEAAAGPAPSADAAATAAAQATLEPSPGSEAFPAALGAQLRTWLQDGVEYATLELNPQDMGPIDVRIALRDGQTLVQLGADVGATRQALAEALPALAEALGDVGLQLAGGSVADQTGQHAQPGDPQAQRGFALPGWLAPARDAGADSAAAASPRSQRGLVDLVA
jgi:flagellar hook-length control protein FliK